MNALARTSALTAALLCLSQTALAGNLTCKATATGAEVANFANDMGTFPFWSIRVGETGMTDYEVHSFYGCESFSFVANRVDAAGQVKEIVVIDTSRETCDAPFQGHIYIREPKSGSIVSEYTAITCE